MTLTELCRFLLGDADAIRRLAADPWSLAVGAVLVLSAGLARHHDAHDLRWQWWRLLVPFAASTLAATALFVVLLLATRGGSATEEVGRGLLGLFWLTAPLAWLYGFPFERLWPPATAARNRRRTLAVVAACRVALMTRCVGVLLGYTWWASLLLVASFALPTALLAIGVVWFLGLRDEERQFERAARGNAGIADAARRLGDHMGGIPPDFPNDPPEDKPERLRVSPPPGLPLLEQKPDAPGSGIGMGCLAVVVVALAALFVPSLIGPPRPWPPPLLEAPQGPPEPTVWVAAGLGLLFWLPWLLLHQPGQRRRTCYVERLRSGPVKETLSDLAALGPGDFPPHWNPATVLAHREFAPRLLEAARVAAELPTGNWVRACFLRRLGQMLPLWSQTSRESWLEEQDIMPGDKLRDLADLRDFLQGLPEASDLLAPYGAYLTELSAATQKFDPPRSEVLQTLAILALKRGPGR